MRDLTVVLALSLQPAYLHESTIHDSWHACLPIDGRIMLSITSYMTSFGLLLLRTLLLYLKALAVWLKTCGFANNNELVTHQLPNDFLKSYGREEPDGVLLVYGFLRKSDTVPRRLIEQFNVQNSKVSNGLLTLKQPGYPDTDLRKPRQFVLQAFRRKL